MVVVVVVVVRESLRAKPFLASKMVLLGTCSVFDRVYSRVGGASAAFVPARRLPCK